jgi:hypothetical protein
MVGVVVLSVVYFTYCSTNIRSFSPTCRKHVGICPKRHEINIVCMLQHEPYVADMIFCVTDTVDDMSLCRVDLAPQKNDTTPTFNFQPSQWGAWRALRSVVRKQNNFIIS